jgi:hypothetical protein
VRLIVERDEPSETRLAALKQELANPEWQDFCIKLGGKESIYSRFFPGFIDTIRGVPSAAVGALWERGLITPAKITAAPDADLLAIKGIGPAKLKAIRSACESAQDKDSELVDCVQR